ncbi:MAG: hypothetical protein L6Q95_05655 [Planctomycetes bacterium]|nr:hypothetical protein [Planctomycetota bacterium]
MRLPAAFLLLATLAIAGDAVHLSNGRVLRGTVLEENDEEVVIDMGAGHLRIPRAQVRLVERGAAPEAPSKTITKRDEWFLVLHREKVVGWQHVVETVRGGRRQVQEETVFFKPGGGDDVSTRRVETEDDDGPAEFLLFESYGGEAEITSGSVRDGRAHARVSRGGIVENRVVDLPEGCALALPAWSRFLDDAKPGETRAMKVFDVRALRPVDLVLRRDEDDAAPDRRPCRAVTLASDVRTERALYRPGEGSLAVELNGPTLLAARVTKERVDLARKANTAPRPLSLEEAQAYPFFERPKSLETHHARAGLSFKAPDAAWTAQPFDAEAGRVLCFEKVALFASVDVFTYAGAVDADEAFARGLARVKLDAKEVKGSGEAEDLRIGGLPARAQVLLARHRGEDLRVLLVAVAAKDRYVLLVGAAPARWWRWAEKDIRALASSLAVAP